MALIAAPAEDQLDSLAASYPEVGKYYFGDGKERLDVLKHDYLATFERLADGVAVDIDEVAKKLEHLSDALGRNDPHLEYGLSIQPTPMLPPSSIPRLIMWEAKNAGGKYFQISTYARYDGADDDANERLQFNLAMTEAAAKRVDHLMAYGGDPVLIRPEELLGYTPPEASQLAMTPTMIQVGARVDATSAEVRLHIDNGNCSDGFTRFHKSLGHSGGTTVWASQGKMLQMRLIGDTEHDTARMQLRWAEEFEGATLDQILKDLRLFKFLREGNTLTLCQTRGPVEGPSMVLENGDMVRQHDLALYQALGNVQDLTTTIVELPEHLDPPQLSSVLRLGALLQGDLVADGITGDSFEMTFPAGSMDLAPGSNYSMTEVLACKVELPHQQIELSEPFMVLRTFRSLRILEVGEPHDETVAAQVEAWPHQVVVEQVVDIEVDEDNPVPDETLLPVFDIEQATTFNDLVAVLADPCRGRFWGSGIGVFGPLVSANKAPLCWETRRAHRRGVQLKRVRPPTRVGWGPTCPRLNWSAKFSSRRTRFRNA